MLSDRWRQRARPWAIVALAAFMLGLSLGVLPTPASVSRLLGVGLTPAYPCAGGQCGCSSIKACWTTCQCQPLAQKVAWARQYNIAIPEYVDLSAAALRAPPMGPACPLCDTGEAPAQITEASVPTLPSLNALQCRGIELLMVISVAPATATTQTLRALAPMPRPVYRLSDQTPPATISLEASTPPPRRGSA